MLPATLSDRISASRSARYIPVSDSDQLLIVFSGRGPGYANPNAFSYEGEIVEPRFNRLLLRDIHGLWFHKGLDQLAGSLGDTVAFLQEFVDAGRFGRVILLGLSSGSHPAFVAGARMRADAVICVGCRFDLSRETREHTLRPGTEKAAQMQRLWTDPEIDRRWLKARDAAEAPGAVPSPVRLYYDPQARPDVFHAGLVDDLPHVSAVHCPGVGHDVNALSAEVFRSDPLLGGAATFRNRTDRLDRRKFAAGSRLADALRARQGAGE